MTSEEKVLALCSLSPTRNRGVPLPTDLSQVFDGVLAGAAVVYEVVEEPVGGGRRHVEGQHLEHDVLHPLQLAVRVRVVRDVDELPHRRRVDLLKFSAQHMSQCQTVRA